MALIFAKPVPFHCLTYRSAAAAAKSLQSCQTVRPHRRQPTRLPRPWDSPGKNTGVGCHFLLQCMKVKSESEVAQLCPTLSDPMDCSLPSSSIHGIFQARVLERGATAFSTHTGQCKENQQVTALPPSLLCWALPTQVRFSPPPPVPEHTPAPGRHPSW